MIRAVPTGRWAAETWEPDLAKRDPESEIQRALVRQGADHLFEGPQVLPSSLNLDFEATIREPENPVLLTLFKISSENPKPDPEWHEVFSRLDVLGDKALSWKSTSSMWTSADPASRHWGLLVCG